MDIRDEANELLEEMIQIRRLLHAQPGIGFDLLPTRDYVYDYLTQLGCKVNLCGKAGLYTDLGSGEGKTILLRSDMDALPIKEETNLPYASQNGMMHACGHDVHTTMLLGAAKLLKKHEDEIQGRVRLMFQPAEEIFEGSKDMIQAGVLEGVDVAMGMHIEVPSNVEAGSLIIFKPGATMPTCDLFKINMIGKGCHGSMPSMGVDPIIIASYFIQAVQEIQTREIGFFDPSVITFGSIHGGNAANIIPNQVELTGSIRTMDEDVRNLIKQRIEEIAKGMEITYRCKIEITYTSGVTCLVNDAHLSDCMYQYAKELLGDKAYHQSELPPSKGIGSEDFSEVSRLVPTIMTALSVGSIDEGYQYPLHHPCMIIDEKAMVTGVASHTYLALEYLRNHQK